MIDAKQFAKVLSQLADLSVRVTSIEDHHSERISALVEELAAARRECRVTRPPPEIDSGRELQRLLAQDRAQDHAQRDATAAARDNELVARASAMNLVEVVPAAGHYVMASTTRIIDGNRKRLAFDSSMLRGLKRDVLQIAEWEQWITDESIQSAVAERRLLVRELTLDERISWLRQRS